MAVELSQLLSVDQMKLKLQGSLAPLVSREWKKRKDCVSENAMFLQWGQLYNGSVTLDHQKLLEFVIFPKRRHFQVNIDSSSSSSSNV